MNNRLQLIVNRLVKEFREMPQLLQVGAFAFILTGALDLAYHILSSFSPGSLDTYLGPDGYYIHLALFFAMLLIIIGVIRIKPRPAN